MVIARYAPLYYPGYWIEINNGQQFVFTITYQEENVQDKGKNVQGKCHRNCKMSQTNVPDEMNLSPSSGENVPKKEKMPQTNVQEENNMYKDEAGNVQGEMSKDAPAMARDSS